MLTAFLLPYQAVADEEDMWATVHIHRIWLHNPETGDGEPEFKLYLAAKYPQDEQYFAAITHPANGDSVTPTVVGANEYLLSNTDPMQLPPVV